MKYLLFIALLAIAGCGSKETTQQTTTDDAAALGGGQSTVQDDESQRNIVQVASASDDHSTLVAALKGAEYVDVLANAGPFTVFAPTNDAFNKLPAGTVDDLLKPENKDKLRNILEYHVYVGVINESLIQDGMTLNQVNLDNVTIKKNGDNLVVNDANVLATIKTSNGIIYSIDAVLLPPDKSN
jgi:uncharacterized surface protein with fasciclin (FAS1) repeats